MPTYINCFYGYVENTMKCCLFVVGSRRSSASSQPGDDTMMVNDAPKQTSNCDISAEDLDYVSTSHSYRSVHWALFCVCFRGEWE